MFDKSQDIQHGQGEEEVPVATCKKTVCPSGKYRSARALEAGINAYFASHNTRENFPQWPDLLNELNLSEESIRCYRTEERYVKAGYLQILKRAERRFAAVLTQLAVDSPNLQSLAIFLLKQPHNGGFRDRPAEEIPASTTIRVEISGAKDPFG